MNLKLQCRCGSLRGELRHTERALRGVCYCKDCRAFAQHLGQAGQVLDTLGGTGFVATQARELSFNEGMQNLACMSLSGKGLLRWYASCCQTPIANTTRDWRFPYVGLMQVGLMAEPAAFEQACPKVQMRVNTASARSTPPVLRWGTLGALAGFIPRVMAARFTGAYRQTPFFNASGQPVSAVTVLTLAERQRAQQAG